MPAPFLKNLTLCWFVCTLCGYTLLALFVGEYFSNSYSGRSNQAFTRPFTRLLHTSIMAPEGDKGAASSSIVDKLSAAVKAVTGFFQTGGDGGGKINALLAKVKTQSEELKKFLVSKDKEDKKRKKVLCLGLLVLIVLLSAISRFLPAHEPEAAPPPTGSSWRRKKQGFAARHSHR